MRLFVKDQDNRVSYRDSTNGVIIIPKEAIFYRLAKYQEYQQQYQLPVISPKDIKIDLNQILEKFIDMDDENIGYEVKTMAFNTYRLDTMNNE